MIGDMRDLLLGLREITGSQVTITAEINVSLDINIPVLFLWITWQKDGREMVVEWEFMMDHKFDLEHMLESFRETVRKIN